MSHPSDDPRAKIVRADKHLEELNEAVAAWTSGAHRPYALYTKPDSKPQTFFFELFALDPTPIQFGVILGDYVHNLRSALDQLVWQMIELNGHSVPRNKWVDISFPIASTFADFLDKGSLRYLTIEQVTFIEERQPYHGGEEHKALRELHDLWNADKHRVINAAVVRLAEQGPKFLINPDAERATTWFDRTVELKTGAKIAGYRLVDPGPDPKVSVTELPVDVGFGPERRLVKDLPLFRETVNSIVQTAVIKFFPGWQPWEVT